MADATYVQRSKEAAANCGLKHEQLARLEDDRRPLIAEEQMREIRDDLPRGFYRQLRTLAERPLDH